MHALTGQIRLAGPCNVAPLEARELGICVLGRHSRLTYPKDTDGRLWTAFGIREDHSPVRGWVMASVASGLGSSKPFVGWKTRDFYWIEIEVISKNIYLIHEEIIKKGSEIIGQLWGHLIKAKREENRVQFREELGGKIQSATSPSEVSSQRGKALSSEQKISKKFWTNLATPAERGWELFWGYNPMAINFVGL